MKERVLLAFLVILLGVGFTYSQTITVTSPHTGDTWTKGQKYTIRWTKSGSMSNFVKIRLYQGNTKVLGIVDRTDNDGSYDWTVPDTINPGIYRIRVKTVDNQVYDDSENFTISNPQPASITVTSPYSGDSWVKGQRYTIRWTKSGSMNDFVKIRLYQGNTKVLGIVERTDNDGRFDWTVPQGLSVGTYKIRVKTVDNQVYDDSENFTVVNPQSASITVTSPHAGDTWTKGQRYTIRWTKTGNMDGFVNITLYRGRVNILEIVERTGNDGSYDWTVPTNLSAGTYMFRVKTTDGQVYDYSDEFTIAEAQQKTPQSPNLKIISLSSNLETNYLYFENTYRIEWNKNYFSMPVKIKLTRGRWDSWPTYVICNYTTDNFFVWRVFSHDSKYLGNNYLEIRTIDEREKAYRSVIVWDKGKIIIDTPSGRETWYKGQRYQIRFHTIGALKVQPGSLSLYNESGRKVLDISSSFDLRTKKYEFTVPEVLKKGKYFIRIKSGDGQVKGDSSLFWIKEKEKKMKKF